MSVYFGEKFKTLRKKFDYTQEQIAEIFHVSPQSVSRWETGANYPDVEILPHLAIFFKVTVDELLGTEDILGEEKVKEYKKDIRNLLNAGKLDKAIDMAHQATKKYPLQHDLQYLLLQSLCTACLDETSDKYKKEIIAIGERILNTAEHNTCLDHRFLLIRQYAKWGMKEEAMRFVNTLVPEVWHTQDLTLGYVSYALEGEDWIQNQKYRIIRFTIILNDLIEIYAKNADIDPLQKIECIKSIMQIESLTRAIHGDDEGLHIDNAFNNIYIAELYCEAGDIDNSLVFVEKATAESIYHIDIMNQTNEDGSNYYAWNTPRNLCWILWEDHLEKSQFDIIRNEKRFNKCINLLKNNSRKLT